MACCVGVLMAKKKVCKSKQEKHEQKQAGVGWVVRPQEESARKPLQWQDGKEVGWECHCCL